MIGIYKITSPTGRVYIGQSKHIEVRFRHYLNADSGAERQRKLKASFNKYGPSAHRFEVLEECEIVELNRRERYYQDLFDACSSFNLNCRLTAYDDNIGKFSDESIALLRKSAIGRKMTPEAIEKMASKKRGKKQSPETIEKRRLASTGKKRKPSFGLHLSSIFKGKKQPEWIKEKLKEASTCKKSVVQYDKLGNFIKEWPSTMQVQRELGFCNTHISGCALGKRKSAYNYIWKYKG